MPVVARSESLAPGRVMGLALGAGGLLAVLVGVPMKAVTFGRTRAAPSVSVGALSADAQRWILLAVGAGLAALLVAQVRHLRLAAAVPLVASGAVIAAAFYALDRANRRPSNPVELLIKFFGNPRPAVGFYFMLVGAIAAAVGSLTVLVTRRNTVMVISGLGVPAGEPESAAVLATLLPLPDRTAGWHPDPAGSGGLRWWGGTRWATGPQEGSPPLPPAGTR